MGSRIRTGVYTLSRLLDGLVVTFSDSKPRRTCKLSSILIASPAHHHIQIRFGRWHGDISCNSGGIMRQLGIFDVIYLWNGICLPILLCVSFFLISVTKLWDMIMRLCVWNGWTQHAESLESKSGWIMANNFNFCLPTTVQWEKKC